MARVVFYYKELTRESCRALHKCVLAHNPRTSHLAYRPHVHSPLGQPPTVSFDLLIVANPEMALKKKKS